MPGIDDDRSRELSMTGAFGTELQQRLQDNLRQRMTIERRWVADGEDAETLSIEAATKAIERAGLHEGCGIVPEKQAEIDRQQQHLHNQERRGCRQ